jgi:hypothetical protein
VSTATPVVPTAAAPGAFSLTRDIVVNGVESVTVPAGTFSALKVTATITYSLNGVQSGTNVEWWAAGTGRVKILNYPTANPSQATTWALTAHSP